MPGIRAFNPVFSPDGSRVAAIEADRPDAQIEGRVGVVVWDTATGRLVSSLKNRRDGVILVPDLVTNDTLIVRQSGSGTGDVDTLWRLVPNAAEPTRIATYPRSNCDTWYPRAYNVVRDADRLRLLDPRTNTIGVALVGANAQDDVSPWAWTGDGRIVAGCVGNRRVVLWDATTGNEIDRFSTDPGPYQKVLFTPDAIRVAVLDGTTGRIDIMDRSSRANH